MGTIKTYVSIAVIMLLTTTFSSCKSKSYPCPKNSSKRAANISRSDDSANTPKGKASKKDNGLIKKKDPKRIHKR